MWDSAPDGGWRGVGVDGAGFVGLSAVVSRRGVSGMDGVRFLVVGTSGVEVVACIGTRPFRPFGSSKAADCSCIAAAFAGDNVEGLSMIGVSVPEGGVVGLSKGL